jgi:hypothetical protein
MYLKSQGWTSAIAHGCGSNVKLSSATCKLPLNLTRNHNMTRSAFIHVRAHVRPDRWQPTTRALCAATAKTPSYPVEDPVRELQRLDQIALRDTERRLDAIIARAKKTEEHIRDLRNTIPVRTLERTRDGKSTPGTIPYYFSFMRYRQENFPKVMKTMMEKAENMKDHLIDLQDEPYREAGTSKIDGWLTDMKKMSRAEKQERLDNMKLEEEARRHRFGQSCAQTLAVVKELQAGKGGVVPERAKKKANPFAASEPPQMNEADKDQRNGVSPKVERSASSATSLAARYKQMVSNNFK